MVTHLIIRPLFWKIGFRNYNCWYGDVGTNTVGGIGIVSGAGNKIMVA